MSGTTKLENFTAYSSDSADYLAMLEVVESLETIGAFEKLVTKMVYLDGRSIEEVAGVTDTPLAVIEEVSEAIKRCVRFELGGVE